MGPRISDSGTESLGARQRHLTREGQGGPEPAWSPGGWTLSPGRSPACLSFLLRKKGCVAGMLCPRAPGCPSLSTDRVRRFLFPFSASPQFLPLKNGAWGPCLAGGGWGWGRGIERPGRWVGGWVREWSFRRDCHCPLAWGSRSGEGAAREKAAADRQVGQPLAELLGLCPQGQSSQRRTCSLPAAVPAPFLCRSASSFPPPAALSPQPLPSPGLAPPPLHRPRVRSGG